MRDFAKSTEAYIFCVSNFDITASLVALANTVSVICQCYISRCSCRITLIYVYLFTTLIMMIVIKCKIKFCASFSITSKV